MADASMIHTFDLMVPPGRLVFHLSGRHGQETGLCPDDPDVVRWVARTACGRLTYASVCHSDTCAGYEHREQIPSTWLRRDQGEILGRICRTCEAHGD